MDSSLALRSLRPSGVTHAQSSHVERFGVVPTTVTSSRRSFLASNFSSTKRNVAVVLSCLKNSAASPSAGGSSGVSPERSVPDSVQSFVNNPTMFQVFESLIYDVCDETEIAELKVKAGGYEMHLKRNIGAATTQSPLSNISPTAPPPIPSEPMEVSAPVVPTQSPPKPSEKASSFTNTSFRRSSKLAALEASGASGYVLVTSPTVGSFQRSRTVKGKKQPPAFKEGDLIKEGQVIGYVDQLGTELPVKTDVAGEVLKLLFDNGEAVGYGDPLIAILPSFHGINK